MDFTKDNSLFPDDQMLSCKLKQLAQDNPEAILELEKKIVADLRDLIGNFGVVQIRVAVFTCR